MRENQFKRIVLKNLSDLPNTWFFKSQEVGRKGIPDIIACINGQFVCIELKVDGEEPTPIQMVTLHKIYKACGISLWSTPSSWSKHYEMLKDIANSGQSSLRSSV